MTFEFLLCMSHIHYVYSMATQSLKFKQKSKEKDFLSDEKELMACLNHILQLKKFTSIDLYNINRAYAKGNFL